MAATRTAISRILALPLTKPRTDLPPLIYYHFHGSPPPKREPNIIERATNKAIGMWIAMGKAPEDSWKRRTFVYGEKLMDRIDFEETALRSVSLQHARPANAPDSEIIPLIYPKSVLHSPKDNLAAHVGRRDDIHSWGLKVWVGTALITAPIGIIPLIPNLPCYFAIWRSWSHWRAGKSVAYLQSYLAAQKIVQQPSAVLDDLYTSNFADPALSAPKSPSPSPTPSTPPLTANTNTTTSTSPPPSPSSEPLSAEPKVKVDDHIPKHPDLLLDRHAVPLLLNALELPETAGPEIVRALEQAQLRLAKRDEKRKKAQ